MYKISLVFRLYCAIGIRVDLACGSQGAKNLVEDQRSKEDSLPPQWGAQGPHLLQELLKPPDSISTPNTVTSVKGFWNFSDELKASFSPFLCTSFLVLETIVLPNSYQATGSTWYLAWPPPNLTLGAREKIKRIRQRVSGEEGGLS